MKRPSRRTAGAGAAPEPLHQPFGWHSIAHDSPLHHHAELASRVRDLAGGLSVVLELIECNAVRRPGADEQERPLGPLLSPSAEGGLLRLCVAVAKVLTHDADHELKRLRAHELRRLASVPEGGQ